MAYDKVIDSAALDANLKTVADAIRAKAGTSGSLSFPAGFAEAIAAIEAGVGNGASGGDNTIAGKKYMTGTFVASTNSASAMGFVPYADVLAVFGNGPETSNYDYIAGYYDAELKTNRVKGPLFAFGLLNTYTTPHYWSGSAVVQGTLSQHTLVFLAGTGLIVTSEKNYPFISGREYRWILMEV